MKLEKPRLSCSPRKATLGAFTLTELIVVIAVAGLIATLQLGALTNSSTEGKSAVCLNNLRQLTRAWLLYAEDNGGMLPPNADIEMDSWIGTVFGWNYDKDFLALTNKKTAILLPYLGPNPYVYKCPAQGMLVPRNYSANGACGSRSFGSKGPVDGPWLDNQHTHMANKPYRTYGKLSDFIDLPPSGLFLMAAEDEYSVNDGHFGMGAKQAEWIDWPETSHGMAGGVSFVDGHAEMHRWQDSRTVVVNKSVYRRRCPGSVDWQWLADRTTFQVR